MKISFECYKDTTNRSVTVEFSDHIDMRELKLNIYTNNRPASPLNEAHQGGCFVFSF